MPSNQKVLTVQNVKKKLFLPQNVPLLGPEPPNGGFILARLVVNALLVSWLVSYSGFKVNKMVFIP